MTMRPRLLVIHSGAIGDLIVALPALERIAAVGDLILMGHGERIALAPYAIPSVTLLDVERVAFHTVFSEPAPALRRALHGVSATLALLSDADGALTRGLQALDVGCVCALPGIPQAGWSDHAVDYYHACATRFLALAALHEAQIAVKSAPALAMPPAASTHELYLHPGSGSAAKNWPLEHFVAVASALERDGLRIAWILGPAEEAMRLPPGARIMARRELMEVAHLLAGADLFIGNDSGIGHLAAACGCPTVSIFCASDPRIWAPRGPHTRVVDSSGPLATPDRVLEACRSLSKASGG